MSGAGQPAPSLWGCEYDPNESAQDLPRPPRRGHRKGQLPGARGARIPGIERPARQGAGTHRQCRSGGHAAQDRGNQDNGRGEEKGRPFVPSWWPDWQGQVCVVVASGPSAAQTPLKLAKGRARVIAINDSWRLCPWADALYACDGKWWKRYHGVPEFRGLKITQDQGAACAYPEIAKVELRRKVNRILTDRPGEIGWGSNSGFHALNLAVQFGARRIVLVGYDMRLDRGVHWHGPHPAGLNNPGSGIVQHWRQVIDGAAGDIAALGIEVVNASRHSALTAYPIVPFEDALQCS